MAKIEWAAYQPSQINWQARDRVEAWSRQPEPMYASGHGYNTHRRSPSAGLVAGIAWAVGMAFLAAVTWGMVL